MTRDQSISAARRLRVLVPIMHPVGGIQTWCKYYYRHPHFREYDIEIIAPMSEECMQLQRAMQSLGIPVTVTGASIKAFALNTWRAIASGRWDLVHAQGFTAGIVCTAVAKLFRVPCLVTQHDVVLADHYADRRGKLIRAATRISLALATRIHSVSESAAANLRLLVRGRKATCKRITVILNGIDTKLFYEAPVASLRTQLGLDPNDFVIGFFGRFMKQKGFSTLVDAVHQLLGKSPPLSRRIVVVAVGSGAFRAREERNIVSMGLQANFRFIDFHPVVASLMKAVDVIAIPSLWEACPLLPMEGLVCGAPLICSDYDALVEVTAHTPTTQFPVKDSAALASAIERHLLTDHRPAAREYAATAVKRYSADPLAADVAALYKELIKRGH
jgi:glycosyltransferase involved in cell wall biosynthesis